MEGRNGNTSPAVPVSKPAAAAFSKPRLYRSILSVLSVLLLMVFSSRADRLTYIAADKVGYESSSQFSREFKRYFGQSPAEMIRELRAV